MGNKIEALYEIHRVESGGTSRLLLKSRVFAAARPSFWAVVDEYGDEVIARGEKLTLQHGARIMLQYPPRPRGG